MMRGIPAMLLMLVLVGCQSAPPQEELPLIKDVRSHVKLPQNPNLPVARALVNVQQIALMLDRSTDAAWDTVDETAFPQLTRSVWNANGLRLGLIHRDQLKTFAEPLPPAVSIRNDRVLASDHPVAVRCSPPLAGLVTVDLTIPPMAVHEEQITSGRAQLLLDVDATQTLHLTPQHYLPQASLLPRNALEKELDGRIYQELALSASLGPQDVLVIGLDRPWPVLRVEESKPAPTDSASGESSSTPKQPPKKIYDLDHPPPLINNLGRALMTLNSGDRPLQLLLLITVEPLDNGY